MSTMMQAVPNEKRDGIAAAQLCKSLKFNKLTTAEKADSPLKYGCDDYWTWNRHDRSHEVRLYDNGLNIAHFHPNWSSGTAAVRGTRVLNNGRYYWEIRIPQRVFGTSMMFGVATESARVHVNAFVNLIGEDENSWGLSHKGLVFHSGKWAYFTKPFKENEPTTVGILFDGIAGTITFYKDGKCLGVAFKNLHKVTKNLYPIISSTAAKTEMVLVTMKRDFVNLQDRCRAVIISQLDNPSDLESVLPRKIFEYLAEAMHRTTEPSRKYYVLDY
ncbi:SPRY domain-containing SOCS box protein 3 [Cimex lectularius]|uniref:B30.2/SPRY domain-containing protein n=1 Tax=Cimex lectularius TaxID=79782 RepID=A0A8I6SKR0_CIMLE|nr:SPRY domain-containing SOCS box protein 3 [Cimex lectularius]XP_024084216.1 SPRY domain-containing SOCS box protein 3 [Cimex lectularius]